MKKYYLVDYENVSIEGLDGYNKLNEDKDKIYLFYTDNEEKI